MAKVGLIDYGAGNFSSVYNALEFLMLDVVKIQNPEDFNKATHLILPGVGAFSTAVKQLEKRNLKEPLREEVQMKKKPFLGICVGMQILASVGYEFEESQGLDFINGKVEKLELKTSDLRLPHMGWNELIPIGNSPLFFNMERTRTFYFLHSYHFIPKNEQNIAAICEYGKKVVAAVQEENIFGVQFHPEKSQHDGITLIKNFISL